MHADLALQLRRSGTGEHTSGTPDRSPSVNAAVVEARGQIESTLRQLTKLIAWERGFTAPRQWVRGRWYVDSSMSALGAFVSRSAQWLAAHPKAADHVQALREISHGGVWSLAYPVGSTRLHIGYCPLVVTWLTEDDAGRQQFVDAVCGERLDWDSNRSALVHCPGCGTDETVEWWQRQIVGDHGGEVTAATAATWLSMHWYRPVQPSVISNWASRGKVPRLMTEPAPGELPRPRRDARGRALFSLADIRACAERTWGTQPQTAASGGRHG